MCEVVPFGEINVNLSISFYLFVVPTNWYTSKKSTPLLVTYYRHQKQTSPFSISNPFLPLHFRSQQNGTRIRSQNPVGVGGLLHFHTFSFLCSYSSLKPFQATFHRLVLHSWSEYFTLFLLSYAFANLVLPCLPESFRTNEVRTILNKSLWVFLLIYYSSYSFLSDVDWFFIWWC